MRRALLAGLAILALFEAALSEAGTADSLPVRGTVRRTDGSPMAGVRAELSPVLGNHAWNDLLLGGELRPPVVAVAETDAGGRFSLAAPEAGIWRVEVRAPGFVPMRYFPLPVTGPVELPPAELLEDAAVKAEVVEASGGAVSAASGVVVIAETASRELWAELRSPGWSVASRNGVTDAQGRVTLPRAAGETLQLTALRPGTLLRARLRAEERARLSLAAAGHPRTLEVREAGEPLEGILVVAGEPAWPLGRTDREGRLWLPAGGPGGGPEPEPLHLFARDGRRWRSDLPQRPAGEGPDPIILRPAAWISGRVLDAASRRPLAGVRIWPGHDPGTAVVTGADGRYRLAAPPDDRFWVQAEAAGYMPESGWVQRPAAAAGRAPTLALVAAASVTGQVVDPAGKPVSGAEIEAFEVPARPHGFHPDPADARAVTDAAGRFTIAGLHPDGAFEVTAARKGFLPAQEMLAGLRRAGERPRLRLVLEPSRSGAGKVVDLEERPLPGVEVRLSASGSPTREPGRTAPAAVTDAEGRFRVDDLPGRELDLEARKPGFSPRVVRRLPIPAGQGPADLGTLVLQPGAAVHGRVIDAAGRAVAGASVWVAAEEGGPPPKAAQIAQGKPAAITDRAGKFEVADLEAGRRIHLAAGRTGYVMAAVRGVEVPARQPVTLTLEPAARVTGEVATEQGEPVAGAAVSLAGRSLPAGTVGIPFRPAELSRRAVTDAAGQFLLEDVASGEAELQATAEGFQPSAPVPVTIAPGKAVDGVRLVLVPGAVLEGTVTVRDGGPRAGASAGARVSAGPVSGISDEDGFYRVTGIPPGPREVEVRHPDFNRQVRRLEIEPGTNTADFVLEGGQRVAGRAVDEDGDPVESARVEIRLQEPWDPHAYTALSDADGSFVFPAVAAGSYDLRAGRQGYAEVETEAAVQVEARPVEGLEVVLRRGGRVSGRLLGLGFEELAAAEVTAEAEHGGTRTGTVDYRGSYEVPDLAPGDWLVRGSVRGRSRQAEARVTIEPGERETERDLRFGGGLTLTGSVSLGGEPLPEARISAHGLEAALVRAGTTDHQGSFRLEGLEPGRYRLSVSSPRELVTYNEVIEVLADREVAIDIPTAQISGSVISEATSQPSHPSQPIPRALVYLQQLVGADSDQAASVVNVITDEEGRFLLARVTAGRHRLLVRNPGYAPAEQTVEVQAGTRLDGVEIRLTPADGLEAVVRLASGRVPAALRMAVFDGAGRLVMAEGQTPDAAGKARFATVPPGTWQVLVTGTGGVGVRLPATVPGPPVEVVLPDAGRMRVRVPALVEANAVATLVLLAPDGRPFESLSPFGELQREWLLPGGSGVVEGLPPGAWRAQVTAPDGQVWQGEAAVVPGGESELVLP